LPIRPQPARNAAEALGHRDLTDELDLELGAQLFEWEELDGAATAIPALFTSPASGPAPSST
jgi:hypothetical protein